jgi:hypothetical protein
MFRTLLSALTFALIAATPAISSGTADVPEFDPNAPVNLDKYEGSEWPDENEVTAAFESQYGAFDHCVAAEKERTGKTARLEGEAGMAVLLSPAGKRPMGVNSNVPKKHQRRAELVRCLRNATASAHYPHYDGPPLVVEFEFEIDPGEEWVEEE